MKIERFEDIQARQEVRQLVKLVYAAIEANERFRKDFRLANQIQALSVSCMANIAEGFSRHGRKEFTQFLYVAKYVFTGLSYEHNPLKSNRILIHRNQLKEL